MRYEGKDLCLEVPEGWEDRSVIAFAAPNKGAARGGPSFIITREVAKPGETLRTFAARQLGGLAKALRNFVLRENRELGLVNGASAQQYEFTWVSPSGPIFQQMTFAPRGDRILILTGSCPKAETDQARPVFEQMIASLELAGASPPEEAPSASPAPRPELPANWWPGARRR